MGFALANMKITSPAFGHRDTIPAKHTGEGEDVSPALSWSGAPDGTQAFAVLCHDPDAPLIKPASYGFVHWLLYDVPAEVTSLDEGTGVGATGYTDFGETGYKGPMPPGGHGVHHYYFWVIALDRQLDLEPGLTLEQFLAKAEPHALGMDRLIGTYERS